MVRDQQIPPPPVLGQVFVHILLWIFRGGPRPRGSSAAAVERGQMATGAVPLMTRIDLLGSFFFSLSHHVS